MMTTRMIFKVCVSYFLSMVINSFDLFQVLLFAVTKCLAQGAPNNGEIQIPLDKPLSILHGEYQIDKNDM